MEEISSNSSPGTKIYLHHAGMENISIVVYNNKLHHTKKRKKDTLFEQSREQLMGILETDNKLVSKHSSTPELNVQHKKIRLKARSSDVLVNKNSRPFKSKYTVNVVSEYRVPQCLNPLNRAKWRIYRCQLSTAQESCCCSCNSDAMFEVMKSLYDCYKKKNCDHCNCILCSHLPREERLLGEMRRSGIDVAGEKAGIKKKKMETFKSEKALEGKTPAQKEKILKDLAMSGVPLPPGKTESEKKLIDKVRRDLGLPPTPKNGAEQNKEDKAAAAGFLAPLEGKSSKEKEKILRGQAKLGLQLPEGRTSSEKALIAKVLATTKTREKPSKVMLKGIPSDKIRKAKEAGFLTPLEGKTPEQRVKILKGLAMEGIPLPEGKTESQRMLIDKVRQDLGLPPTPKSDSEKKMHQKAATAGLLAPLEGKTPAEKEKNLRGQAELGLPLPEGRTPSEKALINKVKASTKARVPPITPSKDMLEGIPSEKIRKAKAAGLITPLEGKTPEQREKILKGLAMQGIPLPEGKTSSQKMLIDKVRKDLGLPPTPKNDTERKQQKKAAAAGLLAPLEGKTPAEKEKILRGQAELGLPLPEGRTPSEKALINKVKASTKARIPPITPSKDMLEGIPSEKIRKAKAAGLITPLEGKTPEQREKILKGLARQGIPLPEGKTSSQKKLIDKVRKDLGLPPTPKNASERRKHQKAAAAGLLAPLEGKSPAEKERILRGQAELGLPLPEGRTPSEKSLINKVKASTKAPPPSISPSKDMLEGIPSEKIRKAKAAGLITPLEGKTPEQREKILKGLAMQGIPLPDGKTSSQKMLIDKVRKDLGLPPTPKNYMERKQQQKAAAAGLLAPLEGKAPAEKEKILRGQAELGLPLPEGRTPSEKALINKVKASNKARVPPITPSKDMLEGIPSEKIRKAKAAGLITPLEGKTPEQREKILKGLAMEGIPLPEGKTASQKKLIDKVRKDLGLPPTPINDTERKKHQQAAAAGLLAPLEGKSPAEKEKILRDHLDMGLPLPEGRTTSEKALIKKVKAEAKERRKTTTRGVAAGPPALPPEEARKLDEKTAKVMKEGKGPADECICGLLTPESERFSVGKGKTLAEKLSAKIRRSKAAGLITPLEGKTPEQREKILNDIAMQGIPLPEGKTSSQKKLIDKIRQDLGLPPTPKNASERRKHQKAAAAGLLAPLEGKSPAEKEKILRGQAELGLPLPEGRTPSEKYLINKVKASTKAPPPSISPSKDMLEGIPSEKIRKAKAAGLITPLEGKTPEQREKILKGLAMQDIPLPEGKTSSQKKLIDKVRKDLGLPPTPKNDTERKQQQKAAAAGFLAPLEGKTPGEKEKNLRGQAELGLPLPEGRTPSEKALINKVKASTKARVPSITPSKGMLEGIPSEKIRKAKAAGLITPLEGKTPEQREKILKGLARQGIPLPEGKTSSQKKLIDKVRKDLGLPPTPKNASERRKHQKAAAAGLLAPLEGKSPAEKERILRGQAELGLPLPEGRTPSEKSLINKVKASTKAPPPSISPSKDMLEGIPSEKIRKAKAAGLITPLEGKTPEQREKILKGLAMQDIPLPEGKTSSQKKLIDKVRKDLGLPPTPKNDTERKQQQKAAAAGFLAPLEGKTPGEKEKILRGQAELGLPLPEGRTPSEKALINKVKASTKARVPSITPSKGMLEGIPSEKIRKAKAAGLITPLEGKTPEQREKILKGLARQGIPLPEGKTSSQKKLIDKVRKDLGLPPTPKNDSERKKHQKAATAGLLAPLEGKSPAEKERILRGQAELGLPLPEGRTPSEKSLINKVKASTKAPPPSISPSKGMLEGIPSEKIRKAKAAGLITPLEGKAPEQREKILKGLAMQGIPLPEGKTSSQKKLIDKVRKDLGLPPTPINDTERKKHQQAAAAGLLAPLEGKSPAEKEKILQGQARLGLPLPEGRTPSEKSLIAKVRATIKALSATGVPSEKLRKAKAAGLLTPLEGKKPAEKEKILRGLALHGIPLPEGKTPSEKKLIEKVRGDLGLPPEPKSPLAKEKYKKAMAAGIVTPLEGKSAAQKEKILKQQAEMGLALPEGRTASEKALIAKVKATTKPPSEGPSKRTAVSPSERLRKAKAAGLVTPLEGKSPEQKEKILRGLAVHGIPLPEGKTASEKKIIEKVRTDLGLPPEPKTEADKEKYKKAIEAGIVTPLEGKTASIKEKILRDQLDMGLPLPEGRTPSEKALIKKVKAEAKERRKTRTRGVAAGPPALPPAKARKLDEKTANVMKEGTGPADECICGLLTPESERFSVVKGKITSEKLKAAKAASLLPSLEGKSPEQKEKIFRGLVKRGLPLPEGKTASEIQLIDKVRADLGLPPEPRTPSIKAKYAKAQAAGGIITPLQGKSDVQKEKILKAQAEMGIPLPEGRTPSEKALIKKIKAAAGVPSVGKTPSEKLRKAQAAGLLTPLEGKSQDQKEKILKRRVASGLPLPEGKTKSEKELIKKIKAETGYVSPAKVPVEKLSEKLRKAKAAGLLTPLEGKSPEKKEKILRDLVKRGLPLPEGKTASEIQLIDKVRADLGLPLEPKTPSIKEKYARAQAAGGIITPLEGKSLSQKEKILKAQADMGIPLPEGRTPSEKALINKVRATAGIPTAVRVPSENIRKAKAAGFLTPLEGKSPEQKEKIIKGLAKLGLPLPEGKTASEKKIIDKVRADMGLPSELKSEKALIEKVKRKPGLPLSEEAKELDKKTAKVMKEGKGPADECICGILTPESEKIEKAPSALVKIPSEKLRKSEEKEKSLKGLAMRGLPLPEGKTASEKKLVEKVRTELGLPPEPKSGAAKEKYDKALAAGVIQPLEGKSQAEKEKILKAQADMGLALPEGRTPSEKSLIAKVKAQSREKLKKLKAAGLLTPIEGKSQAQKEKILKGLAEAGLPLPEGKTASDKALIQKVKTELGIPPEAKTRSEKEIIRKAKAEGILTPLTGKTTAQKEKILKGLAEAGLPMPEGKTASEKSLIRKVRTAAGLPPEPTPSEKVGKIKTKSKKVGAAISKVSKVSAKGVGVGKAKAAGIVEEFQDVQKTTTCERACGCDKKKIRFKHSYVKIRVTSPDISSLCPCPYECVPGVIGGVFTDNDGIKVTVGSAVGVPSYYTDKVNETCLNIFYINENFTFSESSDSETYSGVDNKCIKQIFPKNKSDKFIHKRNSSFTNSELSISTNEETNDYKTDSYIYDYMTNTLNQYEIDNEPNTSRYLITRSESCTTLLSDSINYFEETIYDVNSRSSFESKVLVETESSLSFSTGCSGNIRTTSVISIHNSSITSTSSHYLYYPQYSSDVDSNMEDSKSFPNEVDYSALNSLASICDGPRSSDAFNYIQSHLKHSSKGNLQQNDVLIFRLLQIARDEENEREPNRCRGDDQITVINDLDSCCDIFKIIDELIAKQNMDENSSIFVLMPTSDEYDSDSLSDSTNSTVCIHLSEKFFTWKNNTLTKDNILPQNMASSTQRGLKIRLKGQQYIIDSKERVQSNDELSTIDRSDQTMKPVTETIFERIAEHKDCQVEISGFNPMGNMFHGVSIDTSDRPCCCPPKEPDTPDIPQLSDQCMASVICDIITPMIVSQSAAQGISHETYLDVPEMSPTCQTSFLSPNVTSVSRCDVPASGGHQPKLQTKAPTGMMLYKKPPDRPPPCRCPSDGNNFNSIGCGPSQTGLNNSIRPGPTSLCLLLLESENESLQGFCLRWLCGAGRPLPSKMVEEGDGWSIGHTRERVLSAEAGPYQVVVAMVLDFFSIVRINKDMAGENPCSILCGQPTLTDGKRMSGKEKRVKLPDECPCEQNKPLTPPALTTQGAGPGVLILTKSIGCQCCLCDAQTEKVRAKEKQKEKEREKEKQTEKERAKEKQTEKARAKEKKTKKERAKEKQTEKERAKENQTEVLTKNPCTCESKRGKNKKNVICECPSQPEKEPGIEETQFYEQIDDKQIRKMQSDMCQTTSGFRFDFTKRLPLEEEMSFEDALKYYEEQEALLGIPPHPTEGIDNCNCDKNGKPRKKSADVECECPWEITPEPEWAAAAPKESLKGFKISVGGKGSGSKGLAGMCCFDL